MTLAVGLVARPAALGERLVARAIEAFVRHARPIALGGLALSAIAVGLGLLLWAGERFAPPPMSYVTTVLPIALHIPMALAYALVGTILACRQPRNAIGWLFLLIGLLSSGVPAVDFLVARVGGQFVAPAGSTVFLAWLASSFHLPLVGAAVIVVFLIFPDGRALPGWSRAGWLALVGSLLVGFGQALDPSGLRWYPTLPNPTAAPTWFAPVSIGIQVVGLSLVMGALAAATWGMVLRYRSYAPEARHGLFVVGLAVFALAAAGGALMVVRYGLEVAPTTGEVILVATLVAATAVPIAAAFGMLRYHLFDVDLVLTHALVYIPLTGSLAGLYAASVALFTRIFVALTGDSSDVVIVLSTLLLAGTFAPLRKALENFVDQHFKPGEKAAVASDGGRREVTSKTARRRRAKLDPSCQPDGLAADLCELRLRLARLEEELAEIGQGRQVAER